MGLMGELEQLVSSPHSCSETNSFCQSSCCLCLQVYVLFFWSLQMDWKILVQSFRKPASWYWKVVLPVALSILQGEWRLKFTSGKLSGNTGVFCWLPAVCSAGFLQCFPCYFPLSPMQLQQNRRVFYLCGSNLCGSRGGLKTVMCFLNHKTFGFLLPLYYLFQSTWK